VGFQACSEHLAIVGKSTSVCRVRAPWDNEFREPSLPDLSQSSKKGQSTQYNEVIYIYSLGSGNF
jgi:hypothetical protein